MKRLLILGTVLMFSVITVQAQEVSFGLKGGFNAANTKTDSGFETETRNGFHVGFYAENRLSDVFAIQPELIYSQQGFTESNGASEREQKVDYLNLPVMLKVYVIPGLFVEAGPQIGLAINDKEEINGPFFTSETERNPDSFDYGLGLGGGIKLFNGLMVGARYNIGLGELYEDVEFNNRVFQVYLGIEL